jgi:phage-related protein
MPIDPFRLSVRFYKTVGGDEPVRDWLKGLGENDRKRIGEEIKTVQYRWPIGMPIVRKLEAGLWEVRTHLSNRIARTIFTVDNQLIILLHGFIKKSQRTPQEDIELARRRLREYESGKAGKSGGRE